MTERPRKETLNSWYYPPMRGEMPGITSVAPPAALAKVDKLKNNWLMKHPRTLKEVPMVSLSPTNENGRKEFVVKKVIIYKPQQTE